MEADAPMRPMGHFERFCVVRTNLKFYEQVGVAATYFIPRSFLKKSNLALEPIIYSTLEGLLNFHAILGVNILGDEQKNLEWRRLKTLDLRKVVDFIEQDPLSNPDLWIQTAHRRALPYLDDLPLWKVVVAFQKSAITDTSSDSVHFTVAFFGHHAIADGMSCAGFHLTFLDALNNLIANPSELTSSPIIKIPYLQLLPSMEQATPMVVTFLFILISIFKTFVFSRVDNKAWSGPLITGLLLRPPVPIHRSFSLPFSTTDALVKKCREEKTSITALIITLAARKCALMYPPYTHFCCTMPFSVRKLTGHTPKDMGMFAATSEPWFSSDAKTPWGYIPCSSQSSEDKSSSDDGALWHSSRLTKEYITTDATATKNLNSAMLKFLGDMRGFFLAKIGTKRLHAFEVTNLGVMDGGLGGPEEKREKATFDRAVFSTGLNTIGDPYCISIVSVKEGWMNVTVGWEMGTIEDSEGVEMCDWLEGEMRRLSAN